MSKKLIFLTSVLAILAAFVLYFLVTNREDKKLQEENLAPAPTLVVPITPVEGDESEGVSQEVVAEDEAESLALNPAFFLANKVPYEGASFSIDSYFVATPIGHYAFTVTTTGERISAEEELVAWLKSLGMSDSQIDSLEITYQ